MTPILQDHVSHRTFRRALEGLGNVNIVLHIGFDAISSAFNLCGGERLAVNAVPNAPTPMQFY